MGMFDYLRCEYPLPDGAASGEFQTKDTPDQYMSTYTITADGRLTHEAYDLEEVPLSERPRPDMPFVGSIRRVARGVVPVNLTDAIEFYDETRRYVAFFDQGNLVALRAA